MIDQRVQIEFYCPTQLQYIRKITVFIRRDCRIDLVSSGKNIRLLTISGLRLLKKPELSGFVTGFRA